MEQLTVRYGNATIEYEVRRSARRTKTLQVTVGGEGVQVHTPLNTSDEEIAAFVRRKASWVLSNVLDAGPLPSPKRFVSGETLPYMGRNVILVVEPQDVPATLIRFDHWRFRVTIPNALNGDERPKRVRDAVVSWYRERAADRLPQSVARWRRRLGIAERPQILIRDQQNRWASCASDGTLRFNWRTVMLKPELIDYIVVHEIAHLTHKNHSKEFWALVYRTIPDAERRRVQLREAGHGLPL